MYQPVKLCFLGVCQQNNLWVVMFLASSSFHLVMTRQWTNQYTAQQIAISSAMVFWCGSHSAPSGSRNSCLHAFRWGKIAWHICSCCKVFPCMLLHSVVFPLECHTSGSNSHFLTKAVCIYCQGMLHGILGDDSHGFVHGISLKPFI
jgi:hypothetical protein